MSKPRYVFAGKEGEVKPYLPADFIERIEKAVTADDVAHIRDEVRANKDKSLLTLTKQHVGKTALHIAADLGKTDVARVLIEEGAAIHTKVTSGGGSAERSAMTIAIENSDYDFVAMLLEDRAPVQNVEGKTEPVYNLQNRASNDRQQLKGLYYLYEALRRCYYTKTAQIEPCFEVLALICKRLKPPSGGNGFRDVVLSSKNDKKYTPWKYLKKHEGLYERFKALLSAEVDAGVPAGASAGAGAGGLAGTGESDRRDSTGSTSSEDTSLSPRKRKTRMDVAPSASMGAGAAATAAARPAAPKRARRDGPSAPTTRQRMADILVALINLKQDTDAAAAAAASKEKQQLVDELCGMLGRGVVADLEEVWTHIGRVGQTALQLEAARDATEAALAALQESSGEEVEELKVQLQALGERASGAGAAEAALAALQESSRAEMEKLKKQCKEAQDVTVGAVFKKLEALEGRRVEQVGKMAGEIQRLKAERDEWKKKFEALQAQGEGGRRSSASVSFIDLTDD